MKTGSSQQHPWWRSRIGLALLGCGLIVGVVLIATSATQLAGLLPYGLLLLCPLLHLFMHRGHGNHSDHGGQ